jgi:L-alanine-DL-glutamate epimerase-like enolase superfamily enzyme
VPTWSYETLESVVSTIRDYLAPALIGRDAFDIEGAHAAMSKAIAPSFSTGMPIAKAGIDLALHDLCGRIQGQSVAAMWGRKPLERVKLSWTVNTTSLDEVEVLVEQGRSRGYRNFNTKVAPDPKFDVELCRRVRQLAPKTFLWADANGGYDLASALEAIPKLKQAGVDVLEQPIAPNKLTGFRKLRALRALPILLDEGVVSSIELEEFIALGLLDGVAMKPARTAGLWDARRQVETVLKHKLMFLGSGLTDPDVSLAAALQLYAAYDLKYPAALNGPQFLEGTSFLKQPIQVRDGEAVVPQGPGLGVEVDEQKLRGAAAMVSGGGGFAFEEADGRLTVKEGGKPVLAYNFGMQLANGAPEQYRRSCYVHPVWAPNGALVTDDFPKDHYHHRGIGWMWPRIEVNGEMHSTWEPRGRMRQEFARWIQREAGPGSARIEVENVWKLDGKSVVREIVRIAVSPRHRFDLALTFEALDGPITIAGTQDQGKGYGGLGCRFAPRKNTAIRTDKGAEAKDTDMVQHPWAELEADYAGGGARLRIDDYATNPGYPNGWCLRAYGFLGVNYPGLKAHVLEPGKPLELKYGVTVG